MNKCLCSKCGNNLVIEYVGNYGTIYYIKENGKVGRKLKSIKYEESEDYFVYCPNCGIEYDGRFLNDKFIPYLKD